MNTEATVMHANLSSRLRSLGLMTNHRRASAGRGGRPPPALTAQQRSCPRAPPPDDLLCPLHLTLESLRSHQVANDTASNKR